MSVPSRVIENNFPLTVALDTARQDGHCPVPLPSSGQWSGLGYWEFGPGRNALVIFQGFVGQVDGFF